MGENECDVNSDGIEWLSYPKSKMSEMSQVNNESSRAKVLVKVNCNHSGEFEEENGELMYVNGDIEVLEVDSATIFEDVILKMVHKVQIGKMWYKLPYEDCIDRKPLWENIDVHKRKMTAAGRWMKEVDIFIEKVASQEAVIGLRETSATMEVEAEPGQVGNIASVRLMLSLVRIKIPDEDEVYPDTEDSSGDEEEQAERQARVGLPDGVFSLHQTFNNGVEFKKQVITYILKTRRNIVYDRWEKEKLGARCAGKGCGRKIYCAIENPIKKWMVKTYYPKHICHPTRKCKMIKSPIIADLMLEDIMRDPEMSAPEIREEMKKIYNIIISVPQSRVARRKAFDKLQAECNEQFARLRDYELALIHSNPGSMVEINTTTKPNGAEAFSSMYICFDALRVAWRQYYRPVIGLDGTFLKGSLQGMLLTAIGRDPNNQIYPIAWAVVSVENNDNWQWFIHRLKIDLNLGEGEQITIISDMHRGLIYGVSVELPKSEHRACARHIYSNLKKNHKEFDPRACDELLKKDHHTWCRAFFRVGACCADTHNNLIESFNRTLKIATKKPFVQMLELIRRDAMQRIANRSKTAIKETGRFTPKARKEVAKSCDEAQGWYSILSTGNQFEIIECGNGYSVNLTHQTCACQKWDLTGIPCCHAVCAIREHDREVEDYISEYYLTSLWQACYHTGLRPVNGPKFWKVSGGALIEAPPYKRPPGRPKGKARIKGFHDSPSKKKDKNPYKVGRKGRIPHCSLCGQEGHNCRRCPHESEESRAKRRRLNEEAKEAQVQDVSSTAPSASQCDLN